jgi:hypothetical protein
VKAAHSSTAELPERFAAPAGPHSQMPREIELAQLYAVHLQSKLSSQQIPCSKSDETTETALQAVRSFEPGEVLVQVQLFAVAHPGKHFLLLGSRVLESGRTLASAPDTASCRPESRARTISGDKSGDELSGDSVFCDLHATPAKRTMDTAVAKRNRNCCMGF